MLELQHINKTYGTSVVLDDVCAQIRRGEHVGIKGRNGAGKSTLFKILTRALTPTAGTAHYNGQDLLAMPANALRSAGIAEVTQHPKIVRELSVAENIAVGNYVDRQGRIAAFLPSHDCEAVAALSGIDAEDVLVKRSEHLTLFDIRLVELARATIGKPSLLLLDEPAAGLTAVEKQYLVRILEKPFFRAVALLIIEHDHAFLARTCERVLELTNGHLEERS